MYFFVKCILSGVLVALISEVGRRYAIAGAILASLPITSILALVWLYRDTQNIAKVVDLSNGIALIVLPSLVFFVLLSLLITKGNLGFYASLAIACIGMAITYSGYVWILTKFGIRV